MTNEEGKRLYPELLLEALWLGQEHPDPEIAEACRRLIDGDDDADVWQMAAGLWRR